MPERSNIQIDFSGGTDQRTDARHVVPGKLLSLVNGTFEKSGSIRKRRGFTALSRSIVGGGAIAAAMRLETFGSDLVLSDGDQLYSYSTQAGAWALRDQVPQAIATRNPVAHGPPYFVAPDIAYGNGYIVTAWIQNVQLGGSPGYGDLRLTVIDAVTGAQVMSVVTVGGQQVNLFPRIVVLGTKAYVVYGTTAGALVCVTVDLTNPTSVSAPVTLASDLKATSAATYDATPLSGNLAIVYLDNAGAGVAKLKAAIWPPNLSAASATRTLATTADPTNWFVAADGSGGSEGLWIAYVTFLTSTTTVFVTRLDATTLADNVAPITAATDGSTSAAGQVGIVRQSSTQAVVVWSEQASSNSVVSAQWKLVATTGVVGTHTSYLLRHRVMSRPFMQGGKPYAVVAYENGAATASSTLFLIDLKTEVVAANVSATCGRPVATIAPRRASTFPLTATTAALASVVLMGSSVWATASVVRKSANGKTGLDWTQLDFANPARLTARACGASQQLSGGVPSIYDGARVTENAPLAAPEPPYSFSQSSTIGTGLSLGIYNYCITFARYDMQGQRQRSAPSIATTTTITTGNNTAHFRAPMLANTLVQDAESGFQPAWMIEVWRTTAGGGTFFKLPDAYGFSTSPLNTPTPNDPTAESVLIDDFVSDATLQSQEILYTTGGVLENRCPPSASILTVHKDRVWLAGTDDPRVLWFSQVYTFGELPGFHDDNTIVVEEGGAITALASLDSHLVVFKRDRIFIIDGDGPGTTGGPGFSTPQRISVDLGCIEPRSVAVVPDGVVFRSTAGIYLLDRGLQVNFLSAPVTDSLAANPTITGVVVHESQFEIRFAANGGGATGVVLVYDYLQKQWSTHTYYDATTAQASSAIAAITNNRGVYKWVAPNGTVYEESASGYLDAGTWVTLQLETAWFKAGGLQGWVRAWAVQLLSERFSAHDLTVEVGADYASAYAQSQLWRDGQIVAFPLEQVRVAIAQQKGEAFRFRITDAAPTDASGIPEALGTGQGMALTGLLLEAAVLRKSKRLSAAQRG